MRSWGQCGAEDIVGSGLKGLPCYAALDLGATKDMTALCWRSPAMMANRLLHLLAASETLPEAGDRDGMPYATWVTRGTSLTCPAAASTQGGRAQDRGAAWTYKIKALAFDRWRIEDISASWTRLAGTFSCRRSARASRIWRPPVDLLEHLVEEGKLLHASIRF